MGSANNITKFLQCKILKHDISCLFLLKITIFCVLSCFSTGFEAKAQDIFEDKKEVPAFMYDEIPVLVMIEGYGSFYLDVIYTNKDQLFVNVEDLFKALKIACVVGQKGDSLGGFIEKESRTYSIDYDKGKVKVADVVFNSENKLVKEMGSVYMEASLFAEAFGITLTFNFRSLYIILKSNFELPIIKEQRIEKMRGNISKLKGEIAADTLMQRNYHLLKLGMLDWAVASFQTWNGSNDNHFRLGLGTEFLYGEANVSASFYDKQKFDNRQLNYLWRWVDNNKSLIKQAQLGKISNQSISFLNAPLVGAVIRNAPTTVRKATGYYTIKEFTEPNWSVELYINNVMVDFTKADASGLYVFKVPIVYGYTTLKLKFYGPLGEERTEERSMNTPYTIMAANDFEYGITAGVIQDTNSSRYGKAEFNYGVNRFLTISGGIEYLSSITNGEYIPYAKLTLQPFSKLTLNGEYDHGVKTRGLLNYYFMKDALLEFDYSKFKEGQLATRFNSLEERKAKLSKMFRYRKLAGFVKIDYAQFLYKTFSYNQSNLMLSVYYKQLSFNSSAQLNWIDQQSPYISSEILLSYRLKNGFMILPSARYNVSEHKLVSYKLSLEKNISRGYISIAYERNVLFTDNFVNLNFKYDLPFAKTNFSVARSNGDISTSEGIQGSMAFGGGNNYLYTTNTTSVGKGGIKIYPFLDLNNNGIFDKGETMVLVKTLRIIGGKVDYNEKDSIVRITDLNAFTTYNIGFNDNDLENIAWRFKKKSYQVIIDPNQFKRIDIPIHVVGEVSGTVFLERNHTMRGIGRIKVNIFNKKSEKYVAEMLSESDGYLYYIGLEPGDYIAMVDVDQLNHLDFSVNKANIDFTIKSSIEGDIVGGIDFIVNKNDENLILIQDNTKQNQSTDTIAIPVAPQKKQGINNLNNIQKTPPIKNNQLKIHEIFKTDTAQIALYTIQCGAYSAKSKAMKIAVKLKQNTDVAVEVVFNKGLYKVQLGSYANKAEAEKALRLFTDKRLSENMFISIRK